MWRTRVVLGSCYHEDFVGSKVYELVKEFSQIPPAQVDKQKDIIRYEVPVSQVSGFVDDDRMHFVEVDSHCTLIRSEGVQRMHRPITIKLAHACIPRDYDRMTIYREQVYPDSFLLKEEANFSHVKFIHERVNSSLPGWEYSWKTCLQRQWICPYYSSSDPESIVFRCKPMYSIEVLIDDLPSVDTIEKFVNTAMPSYLRGHYEVNK